MRNLSQFTVTRKTDFGSQFEARVPARKFRKYVCVGRVGREAEKKTQDVVEHAEEVVWSDGKVATEAANAVA